MVDVAKNYDELLNFVDSYIPVRAPLLKAMYEDLGERLLLAPASSYAHFHNCFPGGYLDHVLRVTRNALTLYDTFQELGMDMGNYTKENVVFCALNHDLGKLGFPGEGNENYLPNKDAWSRNNRGKIYDMNLSIPFAIVSDRSLYLLQYYEIPVEWDEYVTIKIHDGLFDDANKAYYVSRYDSPKLKTNLPYLVHTADLLAARKEWELWAKTNTTEGSDAKLNMNYGKRAKAVKLGNVAVANAVEGADPMAMFDSLFGPKS